VTEHVCQLAELLTDLPFHCIAGSLQCPVRNVSADSRHIAPGTLFVALRGLHADGHCFVDVALDHGATVVVGEAFSVQLLQRVQVEGQTVLQVPDSRQALALIASAFYQHPSRHLHLIGITGTNGKTTTAYIVESILQAAGHAVGVLGTMNYRYGSHRQAAVQTTPEALCLQQLLRHMVEAQMTYAVLEVSSHALAQARVDACSFETCVFTNLSRDHFDYHRTEEAYFAAKARLFQDFPARWHVLNVDDPYGHALQRSSQARLLTYGLQSEAMLKPSAVQQTAHGLEFTLPTTQGRLSIRSALIGQYNMYNLLAGIAVAIALEVEAEAIICGIARLRQIPGCLERIDAGQDFGVFVDYAHTPGALEQVLRAVRATTAGRLITVFGCGGDRDPGKRPIMGKIATTLSDYTVITSDNPRTEDPQHIVNDIVAGVDVTQRYTTMLDRRYAILHALDMARSHDTVIIAGKGYEASQIIGTTHLYFDDREVTRAALKRRC
jgi:UDP-N-acetylmuramoyl-L-alanyl-D-glutamate--2,6-diaminopimelate ligase